MAPASPHRHAWYSIVNGLLEITVLQFSQSQSVGVAWLHMSACIAKESPRNQPAIKVLMVTCRSTVATIGTPPPPPTLHGILARVKGRTDQTISSQWFASVRLAGSKLALSGMIAIDEELMQRIAMKVPSYKLMPDQALLLIARACSNRNGLASPATPGQGR